MIQKRSGVFETNSSSTHSISVADLRPGDLLDTFGYIDDDGVIWPNGEIHFGWEYETFRDVDSKFCYMWLYAKNYYPEDKIGDTLLTDILLNVVFTQTGALAVGDLDKISEDGYIDHQSCEDHDYHYLFEDPELLRLFIFHPNSELITKNDNEHD